MIRLLIFCMLFTSFGFADPGGVIPVKKGDIISQDGYYITPQKAQDFANVIIEKDNAVLLNTSYQKSLQLQTDISNQNKNAVTLLLQQNDKLSRADLSEKTLNTWERLGWVFLGVLAASAGAYGISKTSK